MYQWGRASDGHEKARPLVYNPDQFFNSQGNYVPMWLPDNPHRFEWSSTTTVEPINDDYVEEKERFHRRFIIDRATPDNNDPNGYNGGNITRSNTTPNTYGDWMTNFNNSLWQGVNGTNNPCPPGFRIPTATDFDNETALTNTNFGRSYITPASVANGYYWTSTTGTSGGTNMSNMYTFLISSRTKPLTVRATGAAVRCIKN